MLERTWHSRRALIVDFRRVLFYVEVRVIHTCFYTCHFHAVLQLHVRHWSSRIVMNFCTRIKSIRGNEWRVCLLILARGPAFQRRHILWARSWERAGERGVRSVVGRRNCFQSAIIYRSCHMAVVLAAWLHKPFSWAFVLICSVFSVKNIIILLHWWLCVNYCTSFRLVIRAYEGWWVLLAFNLVVRRAIIVFYKLD